LSHFFLKKKRSNIFSKMRVTDSIFWCRDSSSSLVTQGPRRRKRAGVDPSRHIFPRIFSSNTPRKCLAAPPSVAGSLGPPPPSPSPPRRVPPSAVGMTPDRNAPPVVSDPEGASLLRQYHRILLVVSSRRAANPTRGGGHTARYILSHGRSGFPHDNAVCRDVYKYKHIARVAHPDKNPVRDA